MGFFRSIRFFSSIKKSKFIIYAANKYLLENTLVVHEIFDFITKHKDLSKVAIEFNATPEDIENIINGMIEHPQSGVYRNHFTPVSGVLFADTLAYLLRSARDQVSEDTAYMEVNNYFLAGDMIFEPEVEARNIARPLIEANPARGAGRGSNPRGGEFS